MVRIGAHPGVLPVWAPGGTDFEKYKWTPGIYDNVSLILTDTAYIESVQIAPRLAVSSAEIETTVVNMSAAPVTVEVKHKSGTWAVSAAAV
ncbi:MAG: hypothetical protein HY821_23465, partial [Acidobacteria bacterium]|nr:hypothetical protein [Acidobacteriota bacterium]